MYALRSDCRLGIASEQSIIYLHEYAIPIPGVVAFALSLVDEIHDLKKVFEIMGSIVSVDHNKLLELEQDIKENYLIFLDEYCGQPHGLGISNACISYLKCSNVKINPIDRPLPSTLTLHITSACDKACRYCYLAEADSYSRHDELALCDVIAIMNEAHSLGVNRIVYIGGEPFMHKDLFHILDYAADKHFWNSVTTKHYFSSEEAKRLREIGRTTVIVSFDTHVESVADYLVNEDQHVQKMKRSISNLLENEVEVEINMVLSSLNAEHAARFIYELEDLGVNRLTVNRYRPGDDEADDPLAIDDTIWGEVCKVITGCSADVAVDISHRFQDIRERSHENIAQGCHGCVTDMIVMPDKKTILCDYKGNYAPFVYGDLSVSSIEEIWRDKKRLLCRFGSRDDYKGFYCETCEAFDRCLLRGACPLTSLNENKNHLSISSITKRLCPFMQ